MKCEKIYIYFDTNAIKKTRGSIFDFEFGGCYSKVNELIEKNPWYNIEIFIPQIVVDELVQQINEEFIKIGENFQGLTEQIERIGEGGLLDNVDLSQEKFMKIIEISKQKYLEKVNILEYPDEMMSDIINRAIHRKAPFQISKNGKKEYKDSGFKDVVFLETIKAHIIKKRDELNNNKFVIISNDNDFSGIKWNDEGVNSDCISICQARFEPLVKEFETKYNIYDYSTQHALLFQETFKEIVNLNMDIFKKDTNINVQRIEHFFEDVNGKKVNISEYDQLLKDDSKLEYCEALEKIYVTFFVVSGIEYAAYIDSTNTLLEIYD